MEHPAGQDEEHASYDPPADEGEDGGVGDAALGGLLGGGFNEFRVS